MNNDPTLKLLTAEWEPILKELGYTKTIGLIKNGTSLVIAKELVKVMKQKENLQLFD